MAKFFSKLDWTSLVIADEEGVEQKVNIADYVKGPVEVKVVKLKRGTAVPLHSHSANTVHLILSGSVAMGRKTFRELDDYECGGIEYRAMAMEDTVMLLIQPQNTKFKFKHSTDKSATRSTARSRRK